MISQVRDFRKQKTDGVQGKFEFSPCAFRFLKLENIVASLGNVSICYVSIEYIMQTQQKGNSGALQLNGGGYPREGRPPHNKSCGCSWLRQFRR